MGVLELLKLNYLRVYLCVFVLGLFCVWFVSYHWKRRYLYKFSWSIHGPYAWPLLGNALQFVGNTESIFSSIVNMFKKYPSPSRCWLGNRIFVLISKPVDLEIILNSPKSLGKEDLYKYAKPIVGTGLFTADVHKWRHSRKIIMPTFNQKILDTFVDVFVEQTNIFVKNMRQRAGKGQFDIFEQVSHCNLDIICETAMGLKVRAQEHEARFVKLANQAMNIVYLRMFGIWYHFDVIFNLFPISKKFKKYTDEIHDFTFTVIKEKRKVLEEKLKNHKIETLEDTDIVIPKRKAFLELLLELSIAGNKITDEEILEEVNTVMIGGSDTTASINSFVCMMLGCHQEIQEQVYQELMEVFGDSTRSVTTADLSRLQLLERVIKETMRLFPVGPVIVRAITDDLQLESCIVPKGVSAVLGIIDLHRNPDIWPDPLKFDPDRFLPEEVQKRHPYSFLPFSGGPRNCIGYRYAYMQMKTFLGTFLRMYRIKANYNIADVRLKSDLMLKPVNGYKVEIELRDQ